MIYKLHYNACSIFFLNGSLMNNLFYGQNVSSIKDVNSVGMDLNSNKLIVANKFKIKCPNRCKSSQLRMAN